MLLASSPRTRRAGSPGSHRNAANTPDESTSATRRASPAPAAIARAIRLASLIVGRIAETCSGRVSGSDVACGIPTLAGDDGAGIRQEATGVAYRATAISLPGIDGRDGDNTDL